MIGKYLVDLKEYSHSNEVQIKRIDKDIADRVTKVEFKASLKGKSKKLKNRVRDEINSIKNQLKKQEVKEDDHYSELTKKVSELEQSTLWKINDYEKLLQTRVNESYMKDFVKGELTKLQREQNELVEKSVYPLEKKTETCISEINYLKDRLGNQIGELQKGSDEFN